MRFEDFAQSHGLIVKDLIVGKWVRCPTTDHPNKLNGSYIFEGTKGAIQNWAVHEKPVSWFSDSRVWISDTEYKLKAKKAEEDRLKKQRQAASKAAWILKSCKKEKHPYLKKKGFEDELGWVWNGLLVVPMRINGNLVGCQLIDDTGTKKFLSGQATKGARATFDNKGIDIVTEGYATALSVRRALKAVRVRYRIHVTFSAGNIPEVSKDFPECVIVGDRDATGIKVVEKAKRPAWFSDVEGEDFNDTELRIGSLAAGQSLLDTLMRAGKDAVVK